MVLQLLEQEDGMSEVSELKSRIRRLEKNQLDYLDVIRDCMTEVLDTQEQLITTQNALFGLLYQMHFGVPPPVATPQGPERQKFMLRLVKNDQPPADTDTDLPVSPRH
jgi:hypothetical protein